MRLHFIVLVVAILIVIDGQPVDRRSQEDPDEEESFTKEVDNGEKKDEVEEVEEEEQDETADKKGSISSKKSTKKEGSEAGVDADAPKEEKKEYIDENDETSDKKTAEVKDSEPHQIEEEEDEASEDFAKKDKVKPAEKKEQDQNDEQADAKETIGSNKQETPAAGSKRDEECCRGHEHEGEHCCHEGEHCCHEGEHGHEEGHHHEGEHNHHDHGYEFYEEWGEHGGHEGAHEGHHGHEHEDDHNHHHEGEHGCCHGHHEHEHEGGGGKDFVPTVAKKTSTGNKGEDNAKKWWMVGDSPHWGGRGHGHWGPPHHQEQDYGGGHHKSHVPACCKSKNKHVRKRCDCPHHEEDPHHLEGYHFHEHGHGGHNDHDHELKGPWAFGYDGFGDDWNDWDHNHGNFEHLQKLDHESHEGHHGDDHGGDCSKRDCVQLQAEALPGAQITAETAGVPVVAPLTAPVVSPAPLSLPVSLLPMPAPAAHHLPYRVCHDCHILRNGGSRCLCKAIKHPAHHAHTHYDHHVYIDCDAAVHNYPTNHICYPRAGIPTPEQATQDEGFSLGNIGHDGAHLHAYRCHDVIENKISDPATKSKRFCVPVGYHGGYGWPYWHGYPGVGTGLWGWGWPWIKNKVPGSKLKEGGNKTEGPKEPNKSTIRRSYIEENKANNTKKQTIHVGYGYASGDNYRLGYGYGGMGGSAGFATEANAVGEIGSQAAFSRSRIETEDDSALTFTKNTIPKPKGEITVTGTKRDIEKPDTNDYSTGDIPNTKL